MYEVTELSEEELERRRNKGTSKKCRGGVSMSPSTEITQVCQVVQSFYDAFNSHDFSRIAEFTTDDWTHINPLGGWARGRESQ